MSTILKKKGITYRLLEKSDLDEANLLISRNSINFDPMINQLNITLDESLCLNKQICNCSTVDKILSFVAIDDKTNKIVALSINDDHLDEPIDFPEVSEKFNPYFALLERLNEEYFQDYEIGMRRNECFHLIVDEIHPDYDIKELEIYNTLFELSIQLAKEEGFKYILEEAVDEESRKFFLSIGFEEIGSINYKDFEFNGTKPFRNANNKSAYLLIKKIIEID